MVNKNNNFGQISTKSGDVIFGDSNINIVIQDLSKLTEEYKCQIESIEKLVYKFKPRTAINLLEDLEKRVIVSSESIEKNKILSKILFLKASCKRELNDYSLKETAIEFIKSFKLNTNDDKLKATACFEYLNLGDEDKALKLVNQILEKNEYDVKAWFVKLICSENLSISIKELPDNVLSNYEFKHSIIYYAIKENQLEFLNVLEGLEITIDVDPKRYKELTFDNKQAWIIGLDLFVFNIFDESSVRYISNEVWKYFIKNNEQIDILISLLKTFVTSLGNTEISDSIHHQKFFLSYFLYFKNKEKDNLSELENLYQKLPKNHWFYTLTLCQAYNYNQQFEKSLTTIQEYEDNGGIDISEINLLKSAVLISLKKYEQIVETYEKYLNSIKVIDERHGFNILTFFNALYRKLDQTEFKKQVDLMSNHQFTNDELRKIFQITCQIRYFDLNQIIRDDIYSRLKHLINENQFDENYKCLIANNLDAIDRTDEAIEYMSTFLNKEILSDNLKFYVRLLNKQIHVNTESGRGIYKELLELLKFWRENSNQPDLDLLGIEHNLNLAKNDWDELVKIDYELYKLNPKDNKYLLFYLIALEKKGRINDIKKLSRDIPDSFDDEAVGIQIAKLFLINKIGDNFGAKIMYKLASNPNNTQARKYYLGISHLFNKGFIKEFESIDIDHWVSYSVNLTEVQEVKIAKDSGIQKDLLGKKVGDKFTVESNFGDILTIEVLKIYNDALRLHLEIQKEAQNPVNELGFKSVNIPEKIEDFEKCLYEQFGITGSQEKAFKEKMLNDYYNYRVGFTEIVRSIFRDNPLDAYFHLTSNDTKFTTLPSSITNHINFEAQYEYALDFTSLLLFHGLESKLGFSYSHKFYISYHLHEFIKLELLEEKNSLPSKITFQITEKGVNRHFIPENFQEKRIELYESILNWIDNNCIIDLVEEKLDIAMRVESGFDKSNISIRLLMDHIFLSIREKFRFITSDSTLFLHNGRKAHNIINPEKYLVTKYPDKCDSEFYKYLLENNYLGININLDLLTNEFFQMLVKSPNNYQKCLENMQYHIHNNPNVIQVTTKFIKKMYLIGSILIEQKNHYAFEIFRNILYGIPKILVPQYERVIKKEFRLLGDLYDEVLKSFSQARSLYGL